jgi:tRNA pseudouridine synthase 10
VYDFSLSSNYKRSSIALKVRLEEALNGGLREIIKAPGCVDVLFSVDCCGRCMLRFLGVRDFEIYELSSREIKEILAKHRQTPPAVSPENTESSIAKGQGQEEEAVCIACVGTVQFAEDIVAQIVERMQTEAYVTKTFNMNVTLPTSTLIRNHALSIYWNQKLSTYPGAQVDIKEIFKLLISWPIERQTGLTLDFAVSLSIPPILPGEERDG